MTGPGGQTFPFTQTFGTPLSASDTASFPVLRPAPPVYEGYGGGYSNSSTPFDVTVYPNGIATAIDAVYQNNGQEWQSILPYYVRRNPDGSWGQPVALGQGWGYDGKTYPRNQELINVKIFGLDKAGDILVMTASPTIGPNTYNLYNITNCTSTDLSTLPALVNNGFSVPYVLRTDDEGRILLWAYNQNGPWPYSQDLLLLTPAGVSSDPIALNAPEPASLTVMALAMAAFAIHRARKRS